MNGIHEVTRTATEWKCSCGRYGVIIAESERSFACTPITRGDSHQIVMQNSVPFGDGRAQYRARCSCGMQFTSAGREGVIDAKLMGRLARHRGA